MVRSRPILVCDGLPRTQTECLVDRIRSPQRAPSSGERLYGTKGGAQFTLKSIVMTVGFVTVFRFGAQRIPRGVQERARCRWDARKQKARSSHWVAAHWYVVFPPEEEGKTPFVGCSGYLPGDLGSGKGEDFACRISSSDCPAVLEQLQREGPRPEIAHGETRSFLSSKASSSGACLRHGGILPPLYRSGSGACPVMAGPYVPTTKMPGAATEQDTVVMQGAHNLPYPVLKGPSALVSRITKENPHEAVRVIQESTSFPVRIPVWRGMACHC